MFTDPKIEVHVLRASGSNELETMKLKRDYFTHLHIGHLFDLEVNGRWEVLVIRGVHFDQDGKMYLYARITRDMGITHKEFHEAAKHLLPKFIYLKEDSTGRVEKLEVEHTYDCHRERVFKVSVKPINRLEF